MEIKDRASRAHSTLDRCEFRRPFQPGFVDCPTFQERPFIALTSFGKPLGTHLSCRHLVAGERDQNRFYARCSLGTEAARLRWLAATGPGRVEVVGALQADFEAIASRYRSRLIEAKLAVVNERAQGSRQPLEDLTQLIQEFLAEADSFLSAHAQRLNEVGLPQAALRKLLAGVMRAWLSSRSIDLPEINDRRLAGFVPEVWAFLGMYQGPPEAATGAAQRDVPVGRSASLLITRRLDPPELVFTGQIGLAETDLVSAALDDALDGRTELHIDLAGVTFCSIEGLRLFVRAADHHVLRLRGTPRHVLRALDAAGWGGHPNMFSAEGADAMVEVAQ